MSHLRRHPQSEWLVPFRQGREPQGTLYLFPYAGAGTGVFHRWPGLLPAELDVVGIRLPGRERRVREPCYEDMDELVGALVAGLAPQLRTPFAFLGHSMGSLVAYEAARGLRDADCPEPEVLIASGRRSPDLPSRTRGHRSIGDEIAEATPRLRAALGDGVFAAELERLAIAALVADLRACATYTYRESPPLSSRMLIFGGREDASVPRDDLLAWRRLGAQPGRVRLFDGGHFFIDDFTEAVAGIVTEELSGAGMVRAPKASQ